MKNSQGFVYEVINDFLEEVQLNEVIKFYEKLPFAEDNVKTEILSNQINRYEILNSIRWKIYSLLSNRSDSKFYFTKLWIAKNTYKNTNASELPFITHFDRVRHLKGMIYLNDVDIDNGPIWISAKRCDWIENLRINLPLNYKSLKLNSDPLKYNNIKTDPIVGKKNTLIIFDTNVPHHAGKVSVNNERRFLRFDYLVKKKFSLFGKKIFPESRA